MALISWFIWSSRHCSRGRTSGRIVSCMLRFMPFFHGSCRAHSGVPLCPPAIWSYYLEYLDPISKQVTTQKKLHKSLQVLTVVYIIPTCFSTVTACRFVKSSQLGRSPQQIRPGLPGPPKSCKILSKSPTGHF